MKIAIGTTSEQKIGYLKEVLKEIGIEAKLIPVEVESGVSDQPISKKETLKGSTNRAKKAYEKNPKADFGIGIEVGYHKDKNGKYTMFCCATIVGEDNFIETCMSSKFLLPKFHQDVLEKGGFLGDYVREYKKDVSDPVTNYVRELIRGRKPLIIEATRNAILNYLES